jgi:putative FmdB family regulatory protein
MPMYSYQCDACEHHWDDFYNIEDRNTPLNEPCPKCGEKAVLKSFSSASYLDESVLNADKNMERSGVLKELERMKRYHPYMRWHG